VGFDEYENGSVFDLLETRFLNVTTTENIYVYLKLDRRFCWFVTNSKLSLMGTKKARKRAYSEMKAGTR
jgi:hypothetical protein